MLARHAQLKEKRASTDDDDLSSISQASKKGKTVVHCMQFISEQVGRMSALLAQEAPAPAQSQPRQSLQQKLEELKSAKEAGLLSDNDYETARANVIRRWAGSP
jgi:hypothetical protein